MANIKLILVFGFILTSLLLFLISPDLDYIHEYLKFKDSIYLACRANCEDIKTACQITKKIIPNYYNYLEYISDTDITGCRGYQNTIWYISPVKNPNRYYKLGFNLNQTEKITSCYYDKINIPKLTCLCHPLYEAYILIWFLLSVVGLTYGITN